MNIVNKLSPMMEQYNNIRAQLPANTILLFRLGDFYEMFFEDASAGAEILEIPLCERNKVPMAGVPVHASKGYIEKLLKAGKKVAICDVVEKDEPGKLVKREIVEIKE